MVLPAVLGSLPLWVDTRHSRQREWRVFLSAVLVSLVVLVVGGYDYNWVWTGFQGSKLWDWIDLLLVPVLLPFVLAWLATRPRQLSAHAPERHHPEEAVGDGSSGARADHQSA
jgi:hypothetical protein